MKYDGVEYGLREWLAIKVYLFGEWVGVMRTPMFRQRLSDEGIPDEVIVDGETLYIKGVYRKSKGALQMAKWRHEAYIGVESSSVIVFKGDKLIVYSTD